MKTTKRKLDKYDKAIAYLKKNPNAIHDSFISRDERGFPLFQFATKDGHSDSRGHYTCCGCPVMIKNGSREGPTDELTNQIREDINIPEYVSHITATNLSHFAKYQRKFDKVLGRK